MGLVAGLCLIIIGLSGSVLVFRQEIESLMMPEQVLAAEPSARRLDLDTLIARVEEQLDSYEPVGWRPSRSSARNDQVFVTPHAGGEPKTLWIDPVVGEIRGSPVNSSETSRDGFLNYTTPCSAAMLESSSRVSSQLCSASWAFRASGCIGTFGEAFSRSAGS